MALELKRACEKCGATARSSLRRRGPTELGRLAAAIVSLRKSLALDVFTKDRQEWQGWQEFRPTRDDFNRPLIFSLETAVYR